MFESQFFHPNYPGHLESLQGISHHCLTSRMRKKPNAPYGVYTIGKLQPLCNRILCYFVHQLLKILVIRFPQVPSLLCTVLEMWGNDKPQRGTLLGGFLNQATPKERNGKKNQTNP